MPATTPIPLPFWKRQFSEPHTPGQMWFDLLVGCFLPLFCWQFDPIVFHSGEFGWPMLSRFQVVAVLVIAIGIASLGAWFAYRAVPSLLFGLLLGGAVHAFLLGLVLLPISMFGLFFVIGILGFSPFFTAFAFWRNAYRAYQASRSQPLLFRIAGLCVGLLICVAIPWGTQAFANAQVAQGIQLIQRPEPAEFEKGSAILQRYKWAVSGAQLVEVYQKETDDRRRQQIAFVYRNLTATDIEHDIARLDAD